jgi:hypothetical protein
VTEERLTDQILEALAVAALALVIVAGSAFIWIGVPVLGFWIAGKLTTTSEGFLLVVLAAVPLAMVGCSWLLYRVAAVYERLRGAGGGGSSRSAWLVSSSDERARLRRARAPRSLIDVAMAVSAIVALVLMFVYFFFIGEMTLVNPL